MTSFGADSTLASLPVDPGAAISVRGIGKKYYLGEMHGGPIELKDAVGDVLAGVLHRKHAGSGGREVLWAIRDVSFDVAPGEALAIVGRNGSGKSTLLQVLARATPPTEGRAVVRGRVAPLLAVGAGFNPEFTGRENIMMSGVLLGLTPAEVRERMPAITAFAGVDRFLDTPVKRYSSGMYVRLAFSVVSHVDPDILIADEVLAVGDAEFRDRCAERMSMLVARGMTLLFVSHSPESVREICKRAIYLSEGRVQVDGPAADVLAIYQRDIRGERPAAPSPHERARAGRRPLPRSVAD